MAHSRTFRSFVRALQRARRANLGAAGGAASTGVAGPRLSRRRVLEAAAAAGGAALAGAAVPLAGAPARAAAAAPRIAVVGAGIAGLNAAYQLKKRGFEAVVFEAQERVGGRILSLADEAGGGLVIELGGQFINTDHADMLALADEFGLRLVDQGADVAAAPFPEVAYVFGGRTIPEAEVAEALRPLVARITADTGRLNRDYDAVAPEIDRLSVTGYLNRHADLLRAPFVRALVEATIRAECGAEPEDSSALQLLLSLPTVDGARVDVVGASDEAWAIEGGNARVISALAQALEGRVHTGCRLERIEPRGAGYRLTFGPDRRVVEADYVIVTVPFPAFRRVDCRVELPPMLRRFIDELELGANEKIFAGFRRKAWRREDGFAGEAWTDLGFCECWDATQRQGGDRPDGVLTFFLGGREVEPALCGRAGERGREFVRRLDGVLPGLEEASTGQFLRTDWRRDPFAGGSYINFKPGQLTAFADLFWIEADDPEQRREVRVGNLVFAGEHLSDAFDGYMNGAAQTGRLAAELVARLVLEQS